MLNIKTLTDTLSRMELPQLQQYAKLHKDDPYIVSMALSIANQKKQMKAGQEGQAGMVPQPKVADQQIAQMVAPPQQQMLPEESGIGTLPAQNMQNFAGGGITGQGDLQLNIPLDLGGDGGGGYRGMGAAHANFPQNNSGFTGNNNAPQVTSNPSLVADQAQRMQPYQAAPYQGLGAPQGPFPFTELPEPQDVSSMKGTTFGGNPQQGMSSLMGLLGGQKMAGGGIVAFDDGGEVPGYKTGGTPDDEVFERAFKKVLKLEGGSKYLKDDAGKGPTKYGINQTANPDVDIKNLTEDQAKDIYRKRYWNAIGGDALAVKNPQLAIIAFDAAVNQGPGTAKQMLAQAGDSPYELLKLRQQRYIDLKNENPEKFGKFLGGWTNRVSSLQKDLEQDRSKQSLPALTPGAEAMAATAPASTNSAVNQIPGQSVQAPAAKDESTFFGGIADSLGLSQEAQRNISNTLMAPTPLAPVTTLPKASSSGLGLAALGERLYNKFVPAAGMSKKEIAALRAETEAARAAEIAQASQLPQRLTPPAQVLEQGSQVIPVTKAGEAAVQSAADLEKVRGVNQSIDQLEATQRAAKLAQESSKLPSAAERLQQASYLRESDEAARLMARARSATNAKTALQVGTGAANAPALDEGIAALTPNENIGESVFDPTLPADVKKDIVDKLKDTTGATTGELKQQAADSGMDFNSFLMRFGLGLMAGESQYASVNVGKAGLGALDAQLAEQKSRQAQALNLSEIGYKQAATKKAAAEAGYLDRFGKDKNLSLEAEKLIAQRMKELPTLIQVQLAQDPARLTAVEANIRKEIYRQLGIESTMAAGAPAPAGGFSVVGSRPS